MLHQLGLRMLDAVYPPLCVGCGAPTDRAHALCAVCWSEITFISGLACAKCGVPLPGEADDDTLCDTCISHPPAWDQGRAALVYAGVGRRMVLAFKHGDRLDLARPMAVWMARAGQELLDRSEVIAPVPLHWRRMLRRTYNQAAALVQQAPFRGKVRAVPDLLTRLRNTPSQDHRNREDRFANQQGAIAVSPRRADHIAGKSVLLVDDVMTTGATLSAAAEACRGAGARRVDVLVLARVARGGKTPI